MRAPLNNPDKDAFFDRELTPHEHAGIRMKKDLADLKTKTRCISILTTSAIPAIISL